MSNEQDTAQCNVSGCSSQNTLDARVARLMHSIGLLEALNSAQKLGIPKRTAIKQLHFTDIRRTHGEERVGSNRHVDARHKREMRLRCEHTGAQRVMRRRSRDIFAAEEELESFIQAADMAYDFDAQFASTDSAEPLESAREENNSEQPNSSCSERQGS